MTRNTRPIIDTFANGMQLTRSARVIVPWPYRQPATYEYPGLGVSSLTNATVRTSQGLIQYPAALLELEGTK